MTAMVSIFRLPLKKIKPRSRGAWWKYVLIPPILPMNQTTDQVKISEKSSQVTALEQISVTSFAAFELALSELGPVDGSKQIWLKYGHDRFVVADSFDPTGPCWETKGSGTERVRTVQHPNLYEFLVSKEKEYGGGVFLLYSQPQGYPLKECVAVSDNIPAELDNGTPDEQWGKLSEFSDLSGLKPRKILTSGGKSYHEHFGGADHFPVAQAVYLRRLLAIALMSDPAVCNPHQPMRVEGFDRHEDGTLKGHQTRVYQSDNRYTYAEFVEGFKRYFAAKGLTFPESITDQWWTVLKRFIKNQDLAGLKAELVKGSEGYEAEKRAKAEKSAEALNERLKRWGSQPITDGLGKTVSECIEEAKHRLGTSLYEKYGYEAGDRRFCCPFHQSESQNSAWVSPASDGTPLFHCPTCTGEKGVNSFSFYLMETRGSFDVPNKKEYVEVGRDYCNLVGVDVPELKPNSKPDRQTPNVVKDGDRQTSKAGEDGDRAKSKDYRLGEEDDSNPPALTLAENLSDVLQNRLIYDDGKKQWLLYELHHPGVFSPISDEYLQQKIGRLLKKWNYKPYSFQYLTNTIKFLRTFQLEPVWNERSPSEFIPFKNGVLEIETGKLLPHSPEYRFTWAMPREHDPNAKDWSKINAFLEQATQGNQQIKLILICFLNAILKGRSDLQKFLHLIGAGGSGKGTFTRLASDLIGQSNVHSSNLEDWCGNRFETANALNKRLISFNDEDKKVGALSRFKQLTGQDNLRAEEKGKKAFSFTYDGMVMVASNFPIFAGDSSSGLSRRLILVPFNHVPEAGDRRQLNKEFQSELSAFTNYLLSISDELVTKTLTETKEIAELNTEFWNARQRTDSIAAWVNDGVIFDPEAVTPIGNDRNECKDGSQPRTLFGAYCLHAQQSGTQSKSVKNFSPDLVELCSRILGKPVERVALRNGKFIKGLRLRTADDFDLPSYESQLENAQKLERYESRYESVTSDVTSETLATQGCYECDESNQLLGKVSEKTENLDTPQGVPPLADALPSVEKITTAKTECDLPVTLVTAPENKGFQPSRDPSPTRNSTRNSRNDGKWEQSSEAIAVDDAQQQTIIDELLQAQSQAEQKQIKEKWGEEKVKWVFNALPPVQKNRIKLVAKAIATGKKVAFDRYDGLKGGGTVTAIDEVSGLLTLSTGEMQHIDSLLLDEPGGAA